MWCQYMHKAQSAKDTFLFLLQLHLVRWTVTGDDPLVGWAHGQVPFHLLLMPGTTEWKHKHIAIYNTILCEATQNGRRILLYMAKYNQKSAAALNYEAIYLTSNANDKMFLNCSTWKTEPARFWKWTEVFMWHPTIYKICISQNTTTLRQQSLCVWKRNIL